MVYFPPARPRERCYLVRARGWPVRRRKTPTKLRTVCVGYARLAAVVLWLESLGYDCSVESLGRI